MSRTYKSLDITGNRYGKLTAVRYSHTAKNYMQYWVFKCDCGNEITTRKTAVISGHCKSCGCMQKEVAAKEVVKTSIKHNHSNTRLYNIWKGMISRCTLDGYKHYSEKGIKVCEEWRSDFMNFYNWAVSNGYNNKLTIDRIDSNGNYEPSNCRWATMREQAQNTSRNHFITHNGERKCIAEWCRELNIRTSTFCQRMKNGLNPFTGERE